MRLTALLFVPLLVLAALPATAEPLGNHDECDNQVYQPTEGGTTCLRLNVDSFSSAASDAAGEYVYLWLGAPAAPGSTEHRLTSLPTVVGVLYGEGNGEDGLQRDTWRSGGKNRPGDPSLLV